MQIKKTGYYSYRIGELAKGCQLCVKGLKTVLFITGICSKKPLCFYCPISDQKLGKDVVYANEWKVKNEKEIIEEVGLCSSKGVGITGGDPLCRLDRTIRIIKLLKTKFNKNFHIHLYTPLNLVNEKSLERLYKAGLDEIRFHPDIDDKRLWDRIELAKKFKWKVGVEIPVIPHKLDETKKLINYIKDKIDFLNLNELEYSDTAYQHLKKRGLKTRESLSYGIKGSEEMALGLLKFCKGINAHYCTSRLKDKVQMANRIKRRAKNVALPFDRITSEGTLIRACIYLDDLAPGLGYRKKLLSLTNKQRNQYLESLKKIRDNLIKKFKIKKDQLAIDQNKLRIIINKRYLRDIKLKKAFVEEYPTWDGIELSVEFKY